MKNGKFRGWKDVFSFTFRQTVSKKGYRAVTILIALLLLAAVALVVVLTGKPSEEKKSPIERVYVVDEFSTDYKQYGNLLGQNAFEDVNYIAIANRAEAIEKEKTAEEAAYVIVELTKDGTNFKMEAILPENSSIGEPDAQELLDAMCDCFEMGKLTNANLTEEQIVGTMIPVLTDYGKIGEEKNVAVFLVKMLGPMVFGLILYMMLLLYGQEVSREVSVEKTSKLTETLLTSIKPYALITGKILAIVVAAIMQFFLWIVSVIGGLLIGNEIAKAMYGESESMLSIVLDFFRENFSGAAFSVESIIFAILFFVLGFLFYCTLSGIAGSMVSKPEDVANVAAIFTFPILISFFVCYFGVMAENETLLEVVRYIPFTAPFCMPVDMLTGAASIVTGIISLVLLIAATMLIIVLSGKLYQGLILYNGQKLSGKVLWNIIKPGTKAE